ncbi:MAG: fructosamine kinase family protein [Lachnospiraceae bacterium]|nr:fructosamine kinase family protein [Lachnospiraceae bacterium]
MVISEGLIERALGEPVGINAVDPVFGGDINRSYRIELSNGRELFIKTNRKEVYDMFEAERTGLNAISSTDAIKVPNIICSGKTDDGAYLLMDFVKGAGRKKDFWERFGRALSKMHEADASSFVNGGRFGFLSDNYIGSGRQINSPKENWIDFFRECRLIPQIRLADRYFGADEKRRFDRLLSHLDDILCEPEKPSLIHGDLWSGNFIVGDDGDAWLIDPATYVGDPEADIAMTELFGGYDSRFYDSYRESGSLREGYKDRRDLYNIYHMLNHLNLFGGGYLPSVMRILNRYV